MGKYIKMFDTHNEYTAFTQTEEFVKPNVSHCITENDIHYNPLIPPIWGAVDLDLSVKWATKNVGAENETDNGLFFAWGETDGYTASQVGSGEGKKYFGWNDYKYANGAIKLTKYCPRESTYLADGFPGDTLDTLENSDDAAFQASNGQYRMPTPLEFEELASGTTNGFLSNGMFTLYEWNTSERYLAPTTSTTNFNGTKLSGNTFVGHVFFKSGVSDYASAINSGEYLFFPACGFANSGSLSTVGKQCRYWSSFLFTNYAAMSFYLMSEEYGTSIENESRCYGYSIRVY